MTTALVTGAGRGIGRALAVELARRGMDVVATMRDPDAGGDLVGAVDGGGSITVERLDVCDPSTIRIPDDLEVLVNNAGLDDEHEPVEHAGMQQWRDVFETNVFGLVEVTRRALPVLRGRGRGVVVNLTSSSLVVPMPFYAVYRASKAAVAALGESLRAELAPHGVRVVEVLPGPVQTDMLAASGEVPAAARHAAYADLAARAHAGRQSVESLITPVAEAARRIADAIEDPNAPLKVACDDLGGNLLEAWRSNPTALLELDL